MTSIIIPFTIGLFVFIISLFLKRNIKKIRAVGEPAEGIIYDLEQSSSYEVSTVYPLVRFVTLDGKWITERSNIALMPGFYKKGEHVNIIYDKFRPTSFFIDGKAIIIVPNILLVGGMIFMISPIILVLLDIKF
jgi:hypothetical protein